MLIPGRPEWQNGQTRLKSDHNVCYYNVRYAYL